MKKILVLGAGMIGKAMAADLSKNYNVTTADFNKELLRDIKLSIGVATVKIDVTKANELTKLVGNYDLVVGAVPGYLGYQTLETVIKAGKNVVDISFFPEDPFHLNKLAQQNEVVAVVDCGVAPGLSNIIAGYHHQHMLMDNFECYVGGLPKIKQPPFEYKAPFSPIDVIEEYTRPARIIVEGEEVVNEALTEIEPLEFDQAGTLEAFNSDGLRTLLDTMSIPNMKEKTLRYPGHAEKMLLLRETGFFSHEEIEVNGQQIKPIELAKKLLFAHWKLAPDEQEFTVMRIIVEGNEDGKQKQYVYNLYDEFDNKTKTSSMARTTGYTCTAAARLVLNGGYQQIGISPPEYLGARDECFHFVMEELKQRGIDIHVT